MVENNVQLYYEYMKNVYLRNLTDLCMNRFSWELPDSLNSCSVRFFENALMRYGIAGLCYDRTIQSFLTLQLSVQDMNVYAEPVKVIGQGYRYSNTFSVMDFEFCYNNRIKTSNIVDIVKYAENLANIDTTLYFLSKKMKQPYIIQTTKDTKLNDRIVRQQIENNDTIYLDDSVALADKIKVLELPIDNANIQSLQEYKSSLLSEILTVLGVNNVEQEKKERLITDEVNANNQKISRYLQSALTERQEFCERVKKKFGLELKVLINANVSYDNILNEQGSNVFMETNYEQNKPVNTDYETI